MLPIGFKEEGLFEKKVSSECMKNGTILVYSRDKKLELYFTSVFAYMQARMIRNDLHVSVLSLQQMWSTLEA